MNALQLSWMNAFPGAVLPQAVPHLGYSGTIPAERKHKLLQREKEPCKNDFWCERIVSITLLILALCWKQLTLDLFRLFLRFDCSQEQRVLI